MKGKTIIAGSLIAVLNALVFVPSLSSYSVYLVAGSLALSVWLVLKALLEKSPSSSSEPVAVPVEPAAPPPAPKSMSEAEVLAVLGVLQSKGRFIDFVMDDISKYSDAQVGAAARVVHEGCKSAMGELFTIEPVATEAEGSRVSVPANHSDWYRLSGSVSGEGPFSGTLVHKGWKASNVNLPRVLKAEEGKLPPIVPAQVEIQ